MKCYRHYERDAVSQCLDCGKALCPECTDKWFVPICDACNLKRANDDKKIIVKNVLLMFAFFIVGYAMPARSGVVKMELGLWFMGIPWGWEFLSRITPKIFLLLPVIGWVLYFIFKLAISMVVGPFAMIFKIYTIARKYINVRNIKAKVEA
jgi:hypothetical protein